MFTYDTTKYVLCVTFLSPYAHRFIYLTALLTSIAHRMVYGTLYFTHCSTYSGMMQMGTWCKWVHGANDTFTLSGNPGMKGIMLLTSLVSKVKDSCPAKAAHNNESVHAHACVCLRTFSFCVCVCVYVKFTLYCLDLICCSLNAACICCGRFWCLDVLRMS